MAFLSNGFLDSSIHPNVNTNSVHSAHNDYEFSDANDKKKKTSSGMHIKSMKINCEQQRECEMGQKMYQLAQLNAN